MTKTELPTLDELKAETERLKAENKARREQARRHFKNEIRDLIGECGRQRVREMCQKLDEQHDGFLQMMDIFREVTHCPCTRQ
tara:strand:+ start:126 stop:374 length:249 start_codon:yes stop_codon:yes gene_type:complete